MYTCECPNCNNAFNTKGSRGHQLVGENPFILNCPSCGTFLSCEIVAGDLYADRLADRTEEIQFQRLFDEVEWS